MNARDILKIQVPERRLISIVDDNKLKEISAEARPPLTLGQKVVHHAQRVMFGDLLDNTVTLIKSIEYLTENLSKKGEKIMVIGIGETDQLYFPPGHPRLNSVYGAHPTDSTKYYPVSDFHRLNFESKFGEAISLLISLGASEITVKHVQGWKKDFASKAGITLADDKLDATAGQRNSEDSSVLFVSELDGHDQPKLPANLHWYEYEPIWQAVATGRIENNLKNFNISVNYNDDFGINAELQGSILKSGFRLSGKFTEQVNTTWSMDGKFGKRQ